MRYEVIYSEWDHLWTVFDTEDQEPISDHINRHEAQDKADRLNARK